MISMSTMITMNPNADDDNDDNDNDHNDDNNDDDDFDIKHANLLSQMSSNVSPINVSLCRLLQSNTLLIESWEKKISIGVRCIIFYSFRIW